MPRAFDIQVCTIYETVTLVLQGVNDVFLYTEYRNIMEGNGVLERQTIKSYNLNNFVCFESGYLQFLSISGPEAGLFLFEDGEFQFNTESSFGKMLYINSITVSSSSFLIHISCRRFRHFLGDERTVRHVQGRVDVVGPIEKLDRVRLRLARLEFQESSITQQGSRSVRSLHDHTDSEIWVYRG